MFVVVADWCPARGWGMHRLPPSQLCKSRRVLQLRGRLSCKAVASVANPGSCSLSLQILKKHYKRTGQRVQSALLANLLAQPFCSLEVSPALQHPHRPAGADPACSPLPAHSRVRTRRAARMGCGST